MQLLRSLLEVAVAAEHLAVVRSGVPALAPGLNMVGMHGLELKLFAADGNRKCVPPVGRRAREGPRGASGRDRGPIYILWH